MKLSGLVTEGAGLAATLGRAHHVMNGRRLRLSDDLKRTPLHDAHVALGARMVPFAGYEMPVQYPSGIMAEHLHTRLSAGLFDVSHMGQCSIAGADFETVAAAMERLVPADLRGLEPGQQRYSQLLNADGGILDDMMITRSAWKGLEGTLYVVVNASRKHEDYRHVAAHLPPGVELKPWDHLALIALQGPKAEEVLAALDPAARGVGFMRSARLSLGGIETHVSRSGYTGEDGFEISLKAEDAAALWARLLSDERAKPVGLGARDSLRLEAGLCLYGHDIDETTSPVEAGLVWSIGKARRGAGGFIGAERVLREIEQGPARKRVGIKPEGRAPAREGAAIYSPGGERIGVVTSGGFGPSVNGPVAMGYVDAAHAKPRTAVTLIVRDKPLAAVVAPLPFVPHAYKR
jgi:aminomethyltransferase